MTKVNALKKSTRITIIFGSILVGATIGAVAAMISPNNIESPVTRSDGSASMPNSIEIFPGSDQKNKTTSAENKSAKQEEPVKTPPAHNQTWKNNTEEDYKPKVKIKQPAVFTPKTPTVSPLPTSSPSLSPTPSPTTTPGSTPAVTPTPLPSVNPSPVPPKPEVSPTPITTPIQTPEVNTPPQPSLAPTPTDVSKPLDKVSK